MYSNSNVMHVYISRVVISDCYAIVYRFFAKIAMNNYDGIDTAPYIKRN